ncbi:hypothetical protein FA09DRAFT_339045 [Tilletiopsis washingtonensis]|uniref:General stress protein FMN-binding split barrel domain-containing protein n=1 Tax=Tilletiopsis washingtonensis TaxID=58919 RepID=A0A316Z9C0_9BASI|nr:hypothetical protein FA09DRAFT_339045 [Tilletiopsis washingtonensis]PWN97542.1 hypothetical protein FA09DRAFT_339045 [Tilletiopsis washingtonensis]
MSTTHQTADPTAQKAAAQADHSGLDPKQKLDALKELVAATQTCMLTSQTPEGRLASRAMHAAALEGPVFRFYTNTESGKVDDLESHPEVNISYVGKDGQSWASVSGRAKINTDRGAVKKHWSSALKAWFDNKKDGKHTGDENDPRVALIDVHPTEIRLYNSEGKFSTAISAAKAAVTGGVAAPGKLIILNESELSVLATHFTGA